MRHNILNSYAPQIWIQPFIYSSSRKYEVILIIVMPTNEFLFTTQVCATWVSEQDCHMCVCELNENQDCHIFKLK